MPTMEQQDAAALVHQALALLWPYMQMIGQAKQGGFSDLEKLMIGMQGTTLAGHLALLCMLAPKEVLAALPTVAPYVRVVLPDEGPVPFISAG